MRIWTIQPLNVWRDLEQKVLRVDQRIVRAEGADRDYAYDWVAAQMRQRLGMHVEGWPWWGWQRWLDDGRVRPDLRAVAYWHPRGEENVRIELELKDSEVLLSDFMSWHNVLNGAFNSLNEADYEGFEAECRAVPGNVPAVDRAGPLWPRVVKSWERIFAFDGKGDPEWCGAPEEWSVQATFWELRLGDVCGVTRFVGRSRATRVGPGGPAGTLDA